MPLPLYKKKSFLIILLSTLILLVLICFYVIYIAPINHQIQVLKTELNNETKMIEKLQAKQNQNETFIDKDIIALQQKLPILPVVDQFILDLEKAEIVSNSIITSMKFNDRSSEATANGDELKFQSQSKQKELMLPEGIQQISVDLTVESPSYPELERFIQALEELDRITIVNQISFSGYPELNLNEDVSNKLTYKLTVTTFYFPKLKDLINQLPQDIVPEGSEKTNPLAPNQRGTLKQQKENENVEGNEMDDEAAKNEPEVQAVNSDSSINNSDKYNIIHHKVAANETLYSISMKYYQNRSGEELIRTWNNMTSDTVYEGQNLKIPILK